MNSQHSILELDRMQAAAASACALLKVLANPDRLLVMCRLSQGDLTVGELEQQLGIRQPTLSQQLAVLRANGLVSTRREGKNIYYAVCSAQALAIMAALYEQFCANANQESAC